MEMKKEFKIYLKLPGHNHVEAFDVTHPDETFSITIQHDTISIINGDNSWSQVKGDAQPQELINQLGEAIETHFYKQAF